jgi:hypothetical protein
MVFDKLRKRANESIDRNYMVALDIGTEFVKAMIAKIDGEELQVVGVGRSRQDIGDMYSGAIADIAGVVQNCEEALAEAEDQAGLQARRVVIGVAGELVKGTTNTIRYRRPQPSRPLDENEMEFIIEKVQERAQEKARSQIGIETGNPDVEIKLVNSALVGIHIDVSFLSVTFTAFNIDLSTSVSDVVDRLTEVDIDSGLVFADIITVPRGANIIAQIKNIIKRTTPPPTIKSFFLKLLKFGTLGCLLLLPLDEF